MCRVDLGAVLFRFCHMVSLHACARCVREFFASFLGYWSAILERSLEHGSFWLDTIVVDLEYLLTGLLFGCGWARGEGALILGGVHFFFEEFC